MKSSRRSSAGSEAAEITVQQTSRGWFRRIISVLRQFKTDLRGPLPGTEGLGRGAKFKARFVHLGKRYGWKLVVAIVVYYLIRDSLLYIIIPYLVARKLLN